MNNPNLEAKYAINWANVAVDPVEGFYQHIKKSLPKICNDFLAYWIKISKLNPNVFTIKETLIKQLEEEIQQEYQKRNILRIRKKNGQLKAACILLFGFIWWKQIKANNVILSEWDLYYKNKQIEIAKIKNSSHDEIAKLRGSFKIKHFINFIFQQLGIWIHESLPTEVIEEWSTKEGFIGLKQMIQGRIKNNPFYNFIYSQLRYKDVVTWEVESFPYKTKNKEGKTVIEYEEIKAKHSEITPFITETEVLLTRSNYDKELLFKIESGRMIYEDPLYAIIENEEFKRKFNFQANYIENREQKVLQLLTIKTQENFVKWATVSPFSHNYLKKQKTGFIDLVITQENKKLINESFEEPLLSRLKLDWNDNVDKVAKKLLVLATEYLKSFAERLQQPLLLWSFAREWYQDNGQYLISEGLKESFKPQIKINLFNIINDFLERKCYYFNDPKKNFLTKTYFKEIISKEIIPNLFIGLYELNAFYGIEKIDKVSVRGEHTGYHNIDVPYVKPEQIIELKKIIYFYHQKPQLDFEIWINDNLDLNIFTTAYEKETIKEFVKENKIHCSNPGSFENAKKAQEMLNLLGQYRQIINQNPQQYSLTINHEALIVTINDLNSYNDEIEKALLLDFIPKWKKIDF